MNDKKQIRKLVLQKRDALSDALRSAGEETITACLEANECFLGAKNVLLYASIGSELSTWKLIENSLKYGKKVFLPKVQGKTMEFYEICSKEQLVEGFHGILEPVGDTNSFDLSNYQVEETIMLMPGVAFDESDNRLGYGGGFYDRYLAKWPELQSKTIAIGYRCQRVKDLPVEETDRKPCQIILV